MSFQKAIETAAREFANRKFSSVGIISHNDTDGITSAAIISEALRRKGIFFQIHFITRKEKDIVEIVRRKKYPCFFLLDYGSEEIEKLTTELPDKTFFVLDHHQTTSPEKIANAFHLNPHFYGLDGGEEVCGATISFLFAQFLDGKNKDLIDLAIVGAVGDFQRKDGKFVGLNQTLFEQALNDGYISVEKGLKFYGWSLRPLHKALEYSTEPFIPGISGSESSAVQFLQELNIPLKKEDGSWRTINDLTEEEKKKLATALILQRKHVKNPENIFEEKILLPKFKIKELQEAEVLSTALNSCAKLEKFGLALAISLGDEQAYLESKSIILDYKKKIIQAVQFYYDNANNPDFVKKTNHAIYFMAEAQLDPNVVSTVATILSGNLEEEGKILFCLAKDTDGIRVSARFIGREGKANLGKLLSAVASALGGQGGGHAMAAGATIPLGKEEMFINAIEEKLNDG